LSGPVQPGRPTHDGAIRIERAKAARKFRFICNSSLLFQFQCKTRAEHCGLDATHVCGHSGRHSQLRSDLKLTAVGFVQANFEKGRGSSTALIGECSMRGMPRGRYLSNVFFVLPTLILHFPMLRS
jgi:hypothetical protein